MKGVRSQFENWGQSRWLPWIVAGATLIVALLHEIIQPPWIRAIPKPVHAVLWAGAMLVLITAALAVGWLNALRTERDHFKSKADEAEHQVAEAYQRLDAIFRVSQKFVEASNENEVVELVLQLSIELMGAAGASFVPLDEYGQPMTAISQGEMPFPVMSAWLEYLAAPTVRERCRSCEEHNSLSTSCPLLKGPVAGAAGIFCLPLRRGEREFGMLNLYLPGADRLDPEAQAFMQAMIDETALALEGVRLRRRELETLRQMQAMRQKTDLNALLAGLLDNLNATLEADFAVLIAPQPGACDDRIRVSSGESPAQSQPFVDGILQGVMTSGEPLILGDVTGDPASAPGLRSLMAAPLFSTEHEPAGALLVGSRRLKSFPQRQLPLLQTVAGQVALIVQNANLMAELEYKTMIQERTRLAREIHDGLAQTLGFLKLQVAQMQNYLAKDEMDRLRQSASLCYTTLSEAYQDARQAIDGLRIWPNEKGLAGWLAQTVAEFEEICEIPVKLEEGKNGSGLPPEVHAQLIRIVQEALNNVRKHSEARQVWISYREAEGDLWLEVRDDGVGFSAEDVSGSSQHGLRGMRERAELIGADFQVVSRPQKGTAIHVRLPIPPAPGGSIYPSNSREGAAAA